MAQDKVHELTYMVGIPIPYLDRRGNPLAKREVTAWRQKAEQLLTECFGGVTRLAAPGLNQVRTPGEGRLTLFEKGQILLLSGCAHRPAFLLHRDRIEKFVKRMGQALDQQDVFVLAFDSDSFLIEVPRRRKT